MLIERHTEKHTGKMEWWERGVTSDSDSSRKCREDMREALEDGAPNSAYRTK